MNIKTLLRLAQNPFYKLNPEQKKQLEEYQNQQLDTKRKHNTNVVRHTTSIKKHDVSIPEEKSVKKKGNESG